MNRMWVRFGLIFSLFALLGPVLLVMIGLLTIQSGVLRAVIRNEFNAEGGLIEQMVTHYQQKGSWDGIEVLLAAYDNLLPSIPPSNGQFVLYFVDEGRTVLYGSDSAGEILSQDEGAHEVLAITVNGRTRGYLSIVQLNRPEPDENRPRPFLVSQVSGALTSLGVFSAIFGLTAGFWVSRAMARPLGQLSETARRLGRRDFTARAEVKGSDELRAVAQAFNDMAHDLDQAETVRRNLVADVAHELRTPLTVLQANLQALADEVYPLTKEEIERLLQQTQLLTHLVGELRELSLAEARQLALQRHPVDVSNLLERTVDSFESAAAQNGVTLVLDTPQSVVIQADSERLQQVLNNLVHNALTYTPSGGRITLGATLQAGKIEITVRDTGTGIAPEHLPRIFDRFYRADKSRSRETGGTGLGLAIAKAIIELHGGQIHAESTGIAGEGATFSIRLPV